MLRFLHTADWHLGHSFHGFDRELEHAAFLQWLVRLCEERQPDALLIAGDIYDTAQPAASAQRAFHDFLVQAHEAAPRMRFVITGGNHDSPNRLEAAEAMYERFGIHVVGTVRRRPEDGEIDYSRFMVPLTDSSGQVSAVALAVPFLRPADLPQVSAGADGYTAGIAELYRQATLAAEAWCISHYGRALPLLALGHCHMQAGQESRDSERVIGGICALGTGTFPAALRYVALGHLHHPQTVEKQRIYYSGSPIPLSFTEREYKHRVLEVSLEAEGGISLESHYVPPRRQLLRVPVGDAQPLSEVIRQLHALPTTQPGGTTDDFAYLEVRVLLTGAMPQLRETIEAAIFDKPVHLVRITHELPMVSQTQRPIEAALSGVTLAELDPQDLFAAAYEEKTGSKPSAEVMQTLQEILLSTEAA
jgi:DNA repair protein SbcD/Mre11